MTYEELRQQAMACLAKSFDDYHSIPPHVVQAAVSVTLSPTPITGKDKNAQTKPGGAPRPRLDPLAR